MTIEVGDKVILIPDERGGYITQKIGTIAAGDKVILFSDGRGGHIAVKSGTIGVGDKVKAISYMGKRYLFGEVIPNPFSGRLYHGLVNLSGNKLRLFGGYSTSGYYNDVLGSNNKGKIWEELVTNAEWTVRWSFGFCKGLTDNILISGGLHTSSLETQDTWESTDMGLTWTQKSSSAGWGGEEGRSGHKMVCTPSGTILLIAGTHDYVNFHNDVWKTTDRGVTWTQVTDNGGFDPRSHFAGVVLSDGRIVIMCGNKSAGSPPSFACDVWGSNDGGESWGSLNSNPGFLPRQLCDAVVLSDDSIVLFGGIGYSSGEYVYFADVWRSINGGTTWTQITASANCGSRYGHRMVALEDDSIIVTGGIGGLNTTWRSTDYGATWKQMS